MYYVAHVVLVIVLVTPRVGQPPPLDKFLGVIPRRDFSSGEERFGCSASGLSSSGTKIVASPPSPPQLPEEAIARAQAGEEDSPSPSPSHSPQKVEDLVPVSPAQEKSSFLRARLRSKLCSLREIIAFQKVPDGLDDVIAKMRHHSVPSGTRLFQQGDPGDRMYIIESGSVDIVKEDEEAAGEEARVGRYQPGECVGHLSLLDSKPRAASAIATKESVLWSLDRETLQDFMSKGYEQLTMADDGSSDEEMCVLPREVFVLSDSTGESAVSAVRKTISQFSHCDAWDMCNIMTYRFVSSEKEVKHVVAQAQRTDAMIVYTLVDGNVKETLVTEANDRNVSLVDLYGPLISKFEEAFGTKIRGTPGRKQIVDQSYMEVMDCIEYTRKMDDGVNPSRWDEADLIIVGPSRAGKTPLSFYLGLRGFKVANYPIVPGEEPPEQLFQFPDKVIALTIKPDRLLNIREKRMRQFGRTNTQYSSYDKIVDEIRQVDKLYRLNPTWLVVDTTNSGLEETAAEIYRHLDQKGATMGGDIVARQMKGFI
eukprot:CAMPEP_0167787720 /NCGR_PEP_ID=MMETSP0111_2-20121227/9606_1 /TAXON_ID=91324 /ORGANISM="Lotharella globosa, Strain CCCM811" /LENGTH=537 /DNA_ID=CAMNT_0007679447 /DNA_START=256 /DNA_END=1870 /DNA_ORIENTATION=+